MSRSFSTAPMAVLLGMLALAVPAAAQALRLGGTGGGMGLAQRMSDAYAAIGPRIEVIVGMGSSGAVNAVADGAIELAVASRPLKSAEVVQGTLPRDAGSLPAAE